jgi:hypothetical protein
MPRERDGSVLFRRLLLIIPAMGVSAGCALLGGSKVDGPGPVASPTRPNLTALRVDTAPVWRPGDRWTYGWTSGSLKGTKTVEVTDVKNVNGVQYYIVKNAEADHYWTLDLHWAASVRDAKVEARMVPPEPWYIWPLESGRGWRHRGVYEQLDGKTEANHVFSVVGSETIEVPAGKFAALKITRGHGSADSDEYWFAPEVRSYVRWIGRRGNVEFEESLVSYQPASAATPVAPARPPSAPR